MRRLPGPIRLTIRPFKKRVAAPAERPPAAAPAAAQAARAIHDLNNLLTAVGGHVYLALSELEPDHPAREFVAAIQEALEGAPQILRAFPRSSAPPPQEPPPATAPGQGLRVMYVDDEEPLVALATRFLGRLGHRVTGFSEAPLALDAFRERPHDFDAVVSDLSMPGLSGVDLVKKILEIRSDVLVVMSSGHVGPQDLALARSAGASELIAKPQSMAELGAILHRILTERQTQPQAALAWTAPRSDG